MNDISKQTLAAIVTANHQAASVFEKYNLDFCCKGKRPLSQACLEKNLPIEQVTEELNNVIAKAVNTDGTLLNFITLRQLCDYIVATHHAYVRQSAPQILFYLEKIANKHGGRHPELSKIFRLFAQVNEELTEHMFKEENFLFPRIKELDEQVEKADGLGMPVSAYIETPIAVMEHEHDHAGSLLELIRELTNNYTPPADACTTYRVAFASLAAFEADLHRHVHMENNILFPAAIERVQKLNTQASD